MSDVFGNRRPEGTLYFGNPSSRPKDPMKECATIQDILYLPFGSVASEGSLAQIASANTGFSDFRSINEESNRDGE